MKHRLNASFHRDNLKMVNGANECQLYDKANYIAFITRAFHITDKIGSIHPDFSKVIAQLTYIYEDQ